ncbi:hypothetical protein B0H10DRAFT_1964837 [Mycena sp. CBHHK59/15]|nr:hypothetical protein B0H10DRAFT_1964837 [Mycena sp. CBHHK59/15]
MSEGTVEVVRGELQGTWGVTRRSRARRWDLCAEYSGLPNNFRQARRDDNGEQPEGLRRAWRMGVRAAAVAAMARDFPGGLGRSGGGVGVAGRRMGRNGASDGDRQLPGFPEFARELRGNEELVCVATKEGSAQRRGACPPPDFVFRTGGTDPGGTNRALRSGPVRGCNFFAQAISAATDGGHIETSFCRNLLVPELKRKRADSPSVFDFLKRRPHKKRDKAQYSMPIAQEIPPHKRMRRRASIISSDSSKHHRPVLTSLLSRKPTRRPTTKSARNLGDSASYASGDSDESSSLHAVQHDPTLSRHPALTRQGVRGRKPRKIIADDEEWKNVDDVPRSQLKGPQKWDPWPDGTWC